MTTTVYLLDAPSHEPQTADLITIDEHGWALVVTGTRRRWVPTGQWQFNAPPYQYLQPARADDRSLARSLHHLLRLV